MRNRKACSTTWIVLILALIPVLPSMAVEKKAVCLNEREFRDKVYACWLGKNIGGTLGMPFEGDTVAHDIIFFTKLKEGEPAANDDLDLQILWLKAMQENNAQVDAFTLGRYWLKYVPVNWNEYGVGKANMKAGLMPPISGEFHNAKWKHSNGAWIRSEIWACLFPGQPMTAAKFAREDACVDHGMSEGTYAEIFTASLESAAFFEHDRDSLLRFALTMIPPDCRVARAVKTAVQAKKEGKNWKQARLAVIADTKDMGWFQAPRNVAFTIIGWLFGEGDFGKSICIAVNCGDDTDCTGATLGSIFGIIGGTKAIPENWRKPIGSKIATVAIKGFPAPATLDILTDSTVAMTRKVLAKYNLPVKVGTGTTEYEKGRQLLRTDKKALEKLWHLSPWQVIRHNRDWVISFDYLTEPVIQENMLHKVVVSVSNVTGTKESYRLKLSGSPENWETTGIPVDEFSVDKNSKRSFEISFLPKSIPPDTVRMNLELVRGADSDTVPFTFFKRKP